MQYAIKTRILSGTREKGSDDGHYTFLLMLSCCAPGLIAEVLLCLDAIYVIFTRCKAG